MVGSADECAAKSDERMSSPSPCGRGQRLCAQREVFGGGQSAGLFCQNLIYWASPLPHALRACPLPQGEGEIKGRVMKFTLSWLKEHLDTDADADAATIGARLTAIGLEVESIADPGGALK